MWLLFASFCRCQVRVIGVSANQNSYVKFPWLQKGWENVNEDEAICTIALRIPDTFKPGYYKLFR